MADVVEAEAAFDAQPVLVGRAVAPGHVADLVVLDLVGDLAADAAVRADALDPRGRPRDGRRPASSTIEDGISAPVGQACTHSPQATQVLGPHRVVHVEHDLGVVVAKRHADDVVDLDLAAGAHAEVAVDAGVQMHRHRRVAAIGRRGRALRKARAAHVHPIRPLPQLGVRVVRDLALGLVGEQQLHDHVAARFWRGRTP